MLFVEGQHDHGGNGHGSHIDPKQHIHSVLFHDAADEEGGKCKAGRTEPSGESVKDRIAGFLIFEAERGHDRLVRELYHIDQGVDDKDAGLDPRNKHQDQGSGKYDRHGNEDKTLVCKEARFVDDPCDDGLEYGRNDIRHGQEYPHFGIAEAVGQQEYRRIGVQRTERHKICRIQTGI